MNRDEIVIEVLSHAKRMISSYAYAYDLDREDIEQELACRLFETWEKAVCKAFSDNALKAYLYSTIRNQLLKMVPREERPLRLDDVEQTLTLNLYCDRDQMDIVMQAVHKALSKCSAKVQAYAVKTYGLADYEPATTLPEAKSGCVRTRSLRDVFSRDEKILALIGS
jgi:DNA-directed RNA polymerase specialized sigma24 family protein